VSRLPLPAGSGKPEEGRGEAGPHLYSRPFFGTVVGMRWTHVQSPWMRDVINVAILAAFFYLLFR
jgi:hypothetical protein